jgi:FkbM family methyltransferase
MKNPIEMRHINDYYIYLNPNDFWISPWIGLDGVYEVPETELLKKILRSGMIVVDIGANIGWYTLLSAKKVGDKGLVIAFEPEPTNFQLLTRSIEYNKFTNVRALQECVSKEKGTRELWLASENSGAHSIINKQGKQMIYVNSITLDEVLFDLSLDKIDVLKIDAEGAEPEIIEGGQKFLFGSRVEHLFLEWNPEVWTDKQKLLANLLDRYDIYQIIQTPFLYRKLEGNSLNKLPKTDLYLRSRV